MYATDNFYQYENQANVSLHLRNKVEFNDSIKKYVTKFYFFNTVINQGHLFYQLLIKQVLKFLV